MTAGQSSRWPLYALGAACAGAIVAAILLVGPAPASETTVSRTATVARGVVQSTVSGSGNLQPASQLDLGFKTSGTVTNIYIHAGEQVVKGQLLATLDPQSAEVTLQQARASLQAAQATLATEEENGGETTQGGGGSGSGSATAAAASVGSTPTGTTTTGAESNGSSSTGSDSTGSDSTGSGTTGTGSTGSTGAGSTGSTGSGTAGAGSGSGSTGSTRKTSTGTSTESTTTGSTGTTTTSTTSSAVREANLASARAAVRSDELTVRSDEQAVTDTKLYAPEDGTIASLSGQVGEVVSGGGTTRASESTSSSSSTSGGATSGRGASTAASSSASSSGGSGSSSSFAVLSNLSSMRLVVPLSESEISSVRRGQIATVTVEALEGKKLAAHVAEIAILSTSNSGVVSYDVTFALDQLDSGVKPGMSASVEVVVHQQQGLNVPTSAIKGGTVTVIAGSKRETRRVTTGLAGDSSTIVTSGLQAGQTVALPSATTTSGSRSSSTSGLRGLRTSIGGTLGGGGAFPTGGGGAFPRGGP